jgi:DinB superfamily
VELRAETISVYTRQALEGMHRALDRFDDETVNARPHGDATNSAAILITHACASARYWFEHIGLGRHVDRDRDSEFTTRSTVAELHALLDITIARLSDLSGDLDAGPTALDHELRVLLPAGDTSDGSIVLHALEELFQHLGHLELTADAVGTPPS